LTIFQNHGFLDLEIVVGVRNLRELD